MIPFIYVEKNKYDSVFGKYIKIYFPGNQSRFLYI